MPRYLCFVPLFRAYNPGNGDHFYTIDEEEFKRSISLGYVDEGVACYVLDLTQNPVPRKTFKATNHS